MSLPEIVVAEVEEGRALLDEALQQTAQLSYCDSCEQALRLLGSDGISGLIVGLHFDGSRMFELLNTVRTQTAYRKIPVLCIRLLATRFPSGLVESARIACRSVGVPFFDYLETSKLEGQTDAKALLRKAAIEALGIKKKSARLN